MAFKLLPDIPHEYVDLFTGILREYKLTFPFTESHKTIRELIDRGIIFPITTPEGWRRYIVETTLEIVKPIFIGVDKVTGHSIYYDETTNNFILRDSAGDFVKGFGKLQITVALSVDTKGHQRLLVEAITSTTISPKDAGNVNAIETEIQERLEEAGAFYFTPEAISVAIKIGTEYLSEEKDSEDYPEQRIMLIYRNEPMQTGKTIDKTYSQVMSEKSEFKTKFGKMRFEGVQIGRAKGQKGLEEF